MQYIRHLDLDYIQTRNRRHKSIKQYGVLAMSIIVFWISVSRRMRMKRKLWAIMPVPLN